MRFDRDGASARPIDWGGSLSMGLADKVRKVPLALKREDANRCRRSTPIKHATADAPPEDTRQGRTP